ncbi:MAG TPA: xanthine dehydrogenase family protein subunit M [Hypericibacter adhaerens]|uniref:FAD binding domain-containing protein n=1 Tax=Hypericibacter adhaerens TaxID=2602016 RepID=UPI002C50DDE8|nr:xanthine dehydrogenase family protein subunit M [Hypericibacter adhaerens]HWA44158.1 xanthine dehydrogenase family protein subunit M [Hypericibacter adhaerens]
MKPAPFAYHAPTSLAAAVDLLAQNENAKILAGGQSLVPMMNFRLAMPDHLIDLNPVTELDRLTVRTDSIEIGAMTRQRRMEFSNELRQACPIIGEALQHVGHRQTRNRGTIGGSLAHADPSAELPTVVLALDGVIEIRGPRGTRSMPMAEFALGFMTTALEPDEIMSAVTLPRWQGPHGYAFVEFARRLGDFAVAAAAVMMALDVKGTVTRVAVALAGVGPVQSRLTAVEEALRGHRIEPALIDSAAALAAEGDANEDIHASADYRRHLAQVLTARGLATAARRAQTQMKAPA